MIYLFNYYLFVFNILRHENLCCDNEDISRNKQIYIFVYDVLIVSSRDPSFQRFTYTVGLLLGIFIFLVSLHIKAHLVPRLARAVTLARGSRPWRGFTHGPFNNTATCPI